VWVCDLSHCDAVAVPRCVSAVHELAAVAGAAGLSPVAVLEVVSSPVLLALTV
jgi:hypothetical protein